MSIQKTPLEHLKQDLNLLYAGMLGLSAAQKELLDELIDQYKDEERNGIENAFFQGGNNTTCVILNKQQGKYANSIDYFTQTYGTPAEVEQVMTDEESYDGRKKQGRNVKRLQFRYWLFISSTKDKD